MSRLRTLSALLFLVGCKEDPKAPLPTAPSCDTAGGNATVSAPSLSLTLADRFEEAFLASPAVADLNQDGTNEIIVPRDGKLVVWQPDGSILWSFSSPAGRIWASPVVADFRDDGQLEVVVASRDSVFMLDAAGGLLSGFPANFDDELRGIAAGDIDGDGFFEIVVSSTNGGPGDVFSAFEADGSVVANFPPQLSGASGCDQECFLAGAFDQNIALGDLDGDGQQDIVVPHDNAFTSIHKGSGEAFDANAIFPVAKTPGVRYLHDLAFSIQGFADDEDTALQAHFTNTPPAIADLDEDGTPEVILLASVQNAAQTDRERGVALWVVRSDASRLPGWEEPLHFPGFLAGLFDPGGNIVAVTNQATVADLDPSRRGPEIIFAGFDGQIHAVGADQAELFSFTYTTDPAVFTGGVIVADLSGDGIPEVVFTTYSTDVDKSALFVLDAAGNSLHQVPLPGRGAMPVPTIADVDGDGTLEIIVSLKDAVDQVQSVLLFNVASAKDNCLLWPTGRGNLLRNGFLPPL